MVRAVADTNVLIVANNKSPQASPACVAQCVRRLNALQKDGRIVLDDGWRILTEYGKNVSSSDQPGVGDAFYKWVLTNHTNPERCEKHSITADEADPNFFLEFPDDPALEKFDPSDRKFVAVAAVSGAPVWNAVDSDGWDFREALRANGVTVEFLCPDRFGGEAGNAGIITKESS